MKNKTKKTIVIVVSSFMIILIITDLVFSTRFFIMHWKKRNPPPISFNEGPNFSEPICNLVLKTSAEDILPDYGLILVKNLRSLGIDVEMKVEEKSTFYAQLNKTHDYDMFLIILNTSEIENQVFWKVGIFNNPTNLNNTIPYVKQAADLLNNATIETDITKKREYLLEWQDLVMNKILFLFPLVTKINQHYNQTIFLGFNLQRPFLGGIDNMEYLSAPDKGYFTKGVAVRKAMCYTIDREEMNDVVNNGEGEIIDSIILPYQSLWINVEVPNYERNADLAYEWFHAAGYILSISGSYKGKYLLFAVMLLPIMIIPAFILIYLTRIWKKTSKSENYKGKIIINEQ